MAIARNKPTPTQAANIAAFGAAAEAAPTTSAPVPPAHEETQQKRKAAPKNTLLRWEGNEALREQILSFAEQERYSIHSVLVAALTRGITQLQEEAASQPPISKGII